MARLPDYSSFAGSIATGNRLLEVLVTECGFSYPDAIKMLSLNSARLLGLNKGELRSGLDADIIAFNDDFTETDVFVCGEKKI